MLIVISYAYVYTNWTCTDTYTQVFQKHDHSLVAVWQNFDTKSTTQITHQPHCSCTHLQRAIAITLHKMPNANRDKCKCMYITNLSYTK